jgi:hypothetical protein
MFVPTILFILTNGAARIFRVHLEHHTTTSWWFWATAITGGGGASYSIPPGTEPPAESHPTANDQAAAGRATIPRAAVRQVGRLLRHGVPDGLRTLMR